MLETIKIILSLLPIIIDVIKQLESIFPESGKGTMKFDLIIKSIQAVYETSDKTMGIIEKMIPTIVDIFNKFGVFKKIQ